jgi:hypothetical protein
MNIDNLTFGELKIIANMFNNKSSEQDDEFVGKYVLCRCYSAGVHAGELVSQKGEVVILKNSRRLWTWGSNGGIALSGVAQLGMASGKKVDVLNPLIKLTGVCETIICTDTAKDSINAYK